jgi:uncharacterized membrane protein YczE
MHKGEKMTAKHIGHFSVSIFAFLLLGLGISLQIKAAIGQSMLNAFTMTIAGLLHFEVGTTLNLINSVFFITYLLMRRTKISYTDIIQIAATIANGYIINFFLYHVFSDIVIESYFMNIVIFLLGLCLASVSLGVVLAIGIIKFPLESLCIILSEKRKKKLTTIRMEFDIFFLLSTLLITFMTGHTQYIREGTIISFFLLSFLMGLSYNFFKNYLGAAE